MKLYFSLGQALPSAAVATWRLKIDTDHARPLRVIRELSELGLLGDADDRDPVTGISRFEAYSRDSWQTELIDGTEWDTWQEAAAEAGLWRLYGGIHFQDGNLQGLELGALIGLASHEAATALWG